MSAKFKNLALPGKIISLEIGANRSGICSILYNNSGTSQRLYDVRLITLVARQRHLSVTLILYYMY